MADAPRSAATPRAGRDESFLRSLAVWGRLTGGSLGLVMVALVVLLLLDASVYAPAEGVETEVQRSALLELGGVWGQGHLFARPMAVCDIEVLLDRRNTTVTAPMSMPVPVTSGSSSS